MAFGYKAKDANKPLWAKGEYNAVLVAVEEKTTKPEKGSLPMLVLTFDVYSGESKQVLDDYIVNPTTLYKLKSFAKAMDALEDFEAETFDASNYVNQSVTLELDVQKGNGGFDDSNKIKKYLSKAAGAPNATAADPLKNNARRIPAGTTIDAEDIPF